MTIPTDGGPAVHDRFDRIEALLHRYPAIAETERAELKRWFTKEATAFEVASLSSKDELRANYRAFRAEHVDRLTTAELAAIIIASVVLLGAIALVALGG